MTGEGRGLGVLLAVLLAPSAFAERGLFNLSLQAGQVVAVAPAPGSERGVPLLATLEYGLSERWSISAAGNVELARSGPTLTIVLGPRLTLFKDFTWAVETLLAPEAIWLPGARGFDLGVRAGLSVRYLLLWGVGLTLEGGVRGRAEPSGPFVPAMQGYLVGGLYIEA